MTLLVQRGNCHFREDGTDPAILYESGALSPPTPKLRTWGGARNSASRKSETLGALKAVELVEAAQLAIRIGKPFNRHLIVHWEKGSLKDADAAAATGRMMKLIRDWVRKQGKSVAYAWVRENGPTKGSHVHVLLHIPAHLSMKLSRRWYREACRCQRPRGGGVRTLCIGGTARAALSGSDWYQANLAKLIHYLLKGVDERTGRALGLDAWQEGGLIVGKRSSVSGALRPSRSRERG